MTALDRFLVGIFSMALLAMVGWLLATVAINSARISVLEQRANTHDSVMDEFKDDLKKHRSATERVN